MAHFAADSDEDCLATIRELLSYIPSNNLEDPPRVATKDDVNRVDAQLDTFIPESPNQPYEMRDLIRTIADEGHFLEVHQHFARNLVVGFIRLNGQSIGVVANQPAFLAGVLDINASRKGARFVRFCDAFNIPLLVLEDVPGFLPGTDQEYGGIIIHGAKLLYALAEATVPKITVITRKAYGGAYCVMNSKHIRADMNFAYPTAEIAVMGAEGAVNILYRGRRRSRREGRRVQGEVREPLHRRGARIRRRDHRAALHAPEADHRVRHAAQQARQEPAEEARQHPAVTAECRRRMQNAECCASFLPSAFCLLTCALAKRRATTSSSITLDTFRADRISANTPNLQKLARESVRFTNADSPVPLTLPAHCSILSGVLPLHHGVRNNGANPFPADRQTLATIFSAAGYRTGAFLGSFVLDHRFGLARGFDRYDDEIPRDATAEANTLEAERRGDADRRSRASSG